MRTIQHIAATRHGPVSSYHRARRTVSRIRAKQIVFSQGGHSDSVYYIVKGSVKLSVTSAEGKEAVLGIVNGGDFFGEDSIGAAHPPVLIVPSRLPISCC